MPTARHVWLRPLSALLCFVLAGGIAACGESEEETQAKKRAAERKAFVRFDSRQVAEHFKRLSGAELGKEFGAQGYDVLALAEGGEDRDAVRNRYGTFSVYVTKDPRSLDRQVAQAGSDKLVMGNVLVESPTADERFERTRAIFKTLGTPPEQVRLPPEETPCERAGIDPESDTDEGTCKVGQQTVTFANADGRLELPSATVSNLKAKGGSLIVSRRFGLTRRIPAQGGFVAVSFRLENTGDEPLGYLRPNLLVDGKRYTPDTTNQFYLQAGDPYPIQPGAFETVVFLWDIPRDAAAASLRKGAVELIAEEEPTTVDYAVALGRIRLPEVRRGSIRGAPA